MCWPCPLPSTKQHTDVPKVDIPAPRDEARTLKNVCRFGLLSKLVTFLVRKSSFHKNGCTNGLVFKVRTFPPHKLWRLQ